MITDIFFYFDNKSIPYPPIIGSWNRNILGVTYVKYIMVKVHKKKKKMEIKM